ncbi:MAG: ImmA/IrrE family metallo-endopeptidase [Propionibacteriaceae bacterium]|nr:ImmA/IrrE family metallo-endopeptidase [Propionibacteriaceae bacterium]
MTDGARTIWLARGLSQRERRCTLAHELVHVDWGHTEGQPANVEAAVNAEAARRLLPDLGTIGRALAWARTLDEAALELWVTREILVARLDALDDSERAHLHPLDPVRAS